MELMIAARKAVPELQLVYGIDVVYTGTLMILYDFICLTLSVTAFCKIGTFYGSMASLAAINYSFGGLASLQETQYLPITRGCSAVLLVNG